MAGSPTAGGSPWVSFLSDYGLDDHFVGVCKGVIASIAPDARVLDVCHQVAPQNVEVGARLFAEAMPYLPVGVQLALVDPFRRVAARPIAVRCGNGAVIVAPDNGLASLAWAEAGGITAVRELSNPALWRVDTPAKSFRGRDLFAPVAAHLATGRPFDEVGVEVDPATLVELSPQQPYVHGDHVHSTVRMIDHFGNLQLNLTRSDIEAAGIALGDDLEIRFSGKSLRVPYTLSFTEVAPGKTFVYENSFRAIAVVTNMGRAVETLRATHGDPVVLARVAAAPVPAGGKMRVIDSRPSTATA